VRRGWLSGAAEVIELDLPVRPPLPPMLARLARELPRDGFVYEPKWDGFRCLAFVVDDTVDLRSRHDRPLARYFPELVDAFRGLTESRFVLDGEIILLDPDRRGLDFAALMGRLHPAASRVARLSRELPAAFVAFDALAVGDRDLMLCPFSERRTILEALVGEAGGPIFVTPATEDLQLAQRWLNRFSGAGVDGVVAKHRDLRYTPGQRAMIKVKRERTADCVVAGFRFLGESPLVSSLLLGLYDENDELRHVGVVIQFARERRRILLEEMRPLAIPLDAHPWRDGFAIGPSPLGRLKGSAARWTPDMEHDWVPLRPERVVEVAFDQVDVDRFRHPARFRRWRPDREARSCRLDQITVQPVDLAAILQQA
jgi:ATP-dependent DNA ligase